MDPRLKAILQKSKMIDEAAKKFDTVDRTTSSNGGVSKSRPTNNGGLFDQMSVESDSSGFNNTDVYSEAYKERVSNSKLPPEIQKAMMENPIPQPSMSVMDDITMDDIKELNPILNEYDEGDEREIDLSYKKLPKRKVISENNRQVPQYDLDESMMRKMIAEELSKVLPKVIEEYFDKKIIKENTRLMKVLLKGAQNKSVY